jgi:hypothetical protein
MPGRDQRPNTGNSLVASGIPWGACLVLEEDEQPSPLPTNLSLEVFHYLEHPQGDFYHYRERSALAGLSSQGYLSVWSCFDQLPSTNPYP